MSTLTEARPEVAAVADAAVEMTYRDAVNAALDDALAEDPSVLLMAEERQRRVPERERRIVHDRLRDRVDRALLDRERRPDASVVRFCGLPRGRQRQAVQVGRHRSRAERCASGDRRVRGHGNVE